MKRLLLGATMALLAFGALSPVSYGQSGIVKVRAPMDHELRLFGVKKPKYQSYKQTAGVCFTPGGWCNVPSFGPCYCCFWSGCWNGHTG